MEVKNLIYENIYTEELAKGAILNEEYQGFKEDYLILHCLLRKHGIRSVFEVGTNMGTGTKIIKNAITERYVPLSDSTQVSYNHESSVVYSLDLPTELAHKSLQHPISEGKGDSVGHRCDLPFVQLRGDSMNFDYSQYPAEAWFIDGEHDYDHPYHEASKAIECGARLIVFHDADMNDVYSGIFNAFYNHGKDQYDLFRVTDTRIMYALKK